MSAEKCPDCGAWWAWPSEHRCPPITSTNHASITAHDFRHFLRQVRKPDEPLGLGAVVEDADGHRWIRHAGMFALPWYRANASSRTWADVEAVRVLSEGVPATDLGG